MKEHSETRRSRTVFVAALALALPLALLAAPAGAQYANDGARQNSAGGWDLPYAQCSFDDAFVSRAECRSHVTTAETNTPGTNPTCPSTMPDYRTGGACDDGVSSASGDCTGAYTWLGGYCSNVTYTNQTDCLGAFCSDDAYDNQTDCEFNLETWTPATGETWTGACRGSLYWDASYGFPSSSSNIAYRNDCTRCHNELYMNFGEAGVGEGIVKQGHKNMGRPLEPADYDGTGGLVDKYYTHNFPWAGSDGIPYASDSSGNPINTWDNLITLGMVDKELYWLYDGWIADTPGSYHEDSTSYSCGRCHMTGWQPTGDSGKQPYEMFPAYRGYTLTGVVGSWDQWGVQCSRCHGSQLKSTNPDTDGNLNTIDGDLRHHPNLSPEKAIIPSGYPNQEWCLGVGLGYTWNTSANRCVDPTLVAQGTCEAAGNRWRDTYCEANMAVTRGTITNMCMDCHRQESGGNPMNPAQPTNLAVGDSHGHLGFLSHWHGNLFLNSPHGRFSGAFAELTDDSKWDSHFDESCTGCHNVHESTVDKVGSEHGGFSEECMECHNKSLDTIKHPATKFTPLENKATDPMEACETCHMPEALHLFRINTDPNYDTFPVAALTGNTIANKADHDGYADAVWVDLDMACGQCHGGGSSMVVTGGSISAATKALTVDSVVGLTVGDSLEIKGAGAGGSDLHTYVVSIADPVVTIYNAASETVGPVEVVQNPPRENVPYMSKATLAAYAEGIHGDSPMVAFSLAYGNPNNMTVYVSASATCSGPCSAISWDWGDGMSDSCNVYSMGGIDSCKSISHDYTATGLFNITLTVSEWGVGDASKTRVANIRYQNTPPTASATCNWHPNTWTLEVTSTSTDPENNIVQTIVDWGDNSVLDTVAPFSHVYRSAGAYQPILKVSDGIHSDTALICAGGNEPVAIPFTVSGTVRESDHATPVPSAKIKIYSGGTLVKTVYADGAGLYEATGLVPGTFSLVASKANYVFSPVGSTVGPSKTNVYIDAVSPRDGKGNGKGKKPAQTRPAAKVKN